MRNYSEDSDACGYGEHPKCDGCEGGHMCMCLCHFVDRGDRFRIGNVSFTKTW